MGDPGSRDRKTVLIIDDDASVLDSIGYFLEDVGYRIVSRSDGASGLEAFAGEPVDAVITDLRMPGLSGLDVIAGCRDARPEVPLIVVSGADDIRGVTESFHRGAWDYIIKPIQDMSLLEHRLAAVLEKARLQRENREYQESLEEKVRLRTAELAETVDSLQAAEIKLKDINANLEAAVEERSRNLETALRRIAQDDRVRSLNRLVAGMAHEVNTPLGVSLSGTSFLMEKQAGLLEKLAEDDPLRSDLEECREAVDLIQTNLRRTDDLIKRFRSIDPDPHGEEPQSIVLARFLDLMARNLESYLADSSVSLTVDCPEDIEIRTLPMSVMQCLEGLIDNSITHAYPSGTGGELRISAARADPVVLIEYADDGIGVDSKSAERLFDPFYTTSSRPEHAGLGLSIVWNTVVERLKGSIECHAEPDRGLRFTIRLVDL